MSAAAELSFLAETRARAHTAVRGLGASLGLLHVQKVMRGLEKRGVVLSDLRALEVFGYTGERMTQHYAPLVRSVEVWEIDPSFEPALRRNVPGAVVKITDSYAEIERTHGEFDLVVIDNFVSPREHFDLFPAVFRALSDHAVLVVLVVPEAPRRTRKRLPQLFNDEHLARRSAFYDVDRADAIPLARVAECYDGLARANGFSFDWHFFVPRREVAWLFPRRTGYYDLAFKVTRDGQAA